jgi:phenylacetate-CoA ligase
MDIHEFIVKKLGMPVVERAKGWPVTRYLRELEKSQWWSPRQLAELQNEKLRFMVKHAYETTRYYRELFDSNGLKPADIRSVEDLPKIPLLTKDMIKANYPDRLGSSSFRAKDVVECSSSGSTGEPVKYWMSLEEKGLMWGCIYRWRRWTGWDLGKKYVNFTNIAEVALKNYPLLAAIEKKLSRVLILDARLMNSTNIANYVDAIMKFDPYMLKGHPSTCYYMAKYMKEHDIKFDLKACVCNGETLYPFIREAVEERFGCGIHDDYGSEGIETAAQCRPDSKFHISSESVICEVVDEKGIPVPSGTAGRLLVTSLGKLAMPFLRYDTQDIASLSDELCSCGRGLPLLENIKGRVVDLSYSPSGKMISVYAFTPLFAVLSDQIDSWQVIHETPGQIVIKLVARGTLEKSLEDHIIAESHKYAGDDVDVRIDYVDDIPLTPSGKRRFFISKCAQATPRQ